MAFDALLKSVTPEVERQMKDYDERQKPLEGELRAATTREKEALAESAKSRKAEAAELEALRANKPKAPTLDKLPLQPDTQFRDPTQALGGMAAVLAMIGSLATRRPLVAGMNAAAGAMEGFHKGDLERVKLEREKWKSEFEKALHQNQQELSQYHAALAESNFDLNAALHKFRAIAAEHQDQIMMAGIEKGDVKFVGQSLKDRSTFQQKIQGDLTRALEHQQNMLQRAAQHRETMAAHAQAQADARVDRGWQVFQGADGKLHQVNTVTGQTRDFQGDTSGLHKLSGGTAGAGADGIGGVGSVMLQDPATGQKYLKNDRSGKAWRMQEDGKYVEINPNDVPAKVSKLGNIGAMGSRESVFTQRVIQAAEQGSRDLENIVALPVTVDRGPYGTFGKVTAPSFLDATKVVIGNKLTPESAQVYQRMAAGLARSLAGIESSGLMPGATLQHAMEAVEFKPGDTPLSKMHALAQMRQIIEAGITTQMHNPRISDSEKEQGRDILKRITTAVPFTHLDLIALQREQQKNPKATLRDVMRDVTPTSSEWSVVK